jgi:hypothetical protein
VEASSIIWNVYVQSDPIADRIKAAILTGEVVVAMARLNPPLNANSINSSTPGRNCTAHLTPVMHDALLPPGDLQQPRVERFVPMPVEATLGKGVVERGAMGALGLGERAVDVKDQGAQGRGLLRGLQWSSNTVDAGLR